MLLLADLTERREARLLDLRASTAVDVPAGPYGGRCPIGAAALPDNQILCAGRLSSVLDTRTRRWHAAAALSPRFAEHASDDYVENVTLDDGRVLFVASDSRHGAVFSVGGQPR
jgi:hypothetical protein